MLLLNCFRNMPISALLKTALFMYLKDTPFVEAVEQVIPCLK